VGAVTFTPVQIQKLLFLIDRRIPEQVGGPHFNFEPYDYGPFDAQIYGHLESMSSEELVEIIEKPNLRWKKYRLTPEGLEQGQRILRELSAGVADYLSSLSKFVTSLSFAELVGAIYRAYPEMKANSVFRD
jgi:uncharacterized protein